MAGVEFRCISKSFGSGPVLSDVSLSVRDGEFLSLLGPSGCGKTTLLRVLAGLEMQDSGEVLIDGAPVDHLAPKKRDVAMVFQSYALYPYMSVSQNIALPLVMRRTNAIERLALIDKLLPSARRKRREIDAEVKAVADSLGIGDYLDRRPAQLSGGQRQRVALARAMVRRPAAFLMDEPLSNLDAKMRVKARAEIAALHRRLGATFIYVTHDQTEAMTMSDRVAVMHGGRILQVDTPQALYADPRHLSVATFVGTPEINVIEATSRGIGIEVAGRVWPLSVDAAVGTSLKLAVRPEAWQPSSPDETCQITGVVQHIEHLGADDFVHVSVPGVGDRVIARLDPTRGARISTGSSVTLSVAVGRVLAFAVDGTRLSLASVDQRRSSPMLLEATHG